MALRVHGMGGRAASQCANSPVLPAASYDLVSTYKTPQEAVVTAFGLLAYAKKMGGKALPVVFDIDDTLVTEAADGSSLPIQPVVDLFHACLGRLGAQVYLVTARLDTKDNRAETLRELAAAGIRTRGVKRMAFAPAKARRNMAAISDWKRSERLRVARETGQCVFLSVGDQWGDLMKLGSPKDIDALDSCMHASSQPYKLVRIEDEGMQRAAQTQRTKVYGLKLKDD